MIEASRGASLPSAGVLGQPFVSSRVISNWAAAQPLIPHGGDHATFSHPRAPPHLPPSSSSAAMHAPPHSLLAGFSGSAQATDKNSADGAAKGQATEGTAKPTKGGKHAKDKKLPGKMKSGT